MKCPKCGSEWVEKRNTCPICGTESVGPAEESRGASVTCPECAHFNDRDATYCVKCGSNIRGGDSTEPAPAASDSEELPIASIRPSWLASLLDSFDVETDQWKVSLVIGIIVFGLLSILLTAADNVCCSAFFLVLLLGSILMYWLSFGRRSH